MPNPSRELPSYVPLHSIVLSAHGWLVTMFVWKIGPGKSFALTLRALHLSQHLTSPRNWMYSRHEAIRVHSSHRIENVLLVHGSRLSTGLVILDLQFSG
jgi:hypothetical protein